MSRLLCDSGVWISTLEPTERFHEQSARLCLATPSSQVELGALDLTLYEVANVAVTRWRSTEDAAALVALVRRGALDAIIPWGPEMLAQAAALAHKHRLSVYDAAYVATSQALGWTLVSTDMRDLVEPGFAITPDQVVL